MKALVTITRLTYEKIIKTNGGKIIYTMKTSKPLFAIIFVATAAISCSKDAKTPPAQEVTPLVKQMVITYPYIRSVYNNTYDDQKRLATVGNANRPTRAYNLVSLPGKAIAG